MNDDAGSLPPKLDFPTPRRIWKTESGFPPFFQRTRPPRTASKGQGLLAWAGQSAREVLSILTGSRISNRGSVHFDGRLAARLSMANENEEPKIEQVKLSKIQPGPIGHESLTVDQLERARAIYECVGPYLRTTFEQFELNFLRDANLEQELQIWGCIALAHQSFLQRQPDATDDEADRAFTTFLLMSMGAAKPNDVPAAVWESLEAIYEGR